MNRLLPILLMLLLCIGCKEKNTYKAIFFSEGKKTLVENGTFFITEKQSPYFYINDGEITDAISDMVIDSIEFSLAEGKYTAKPVRLMFSNRDNAVSDFLFPVDNNSKRIIFDSFGNKKMFTLVTNKTELTDIITPETIEE